MSQPIQLIPNHAYDPTRGYRSTTLLGFLLVLFSAFASAQDHAAPGCPNIPPISPADFQESNGERTSLAASGSDRICGDTIYFGLKRFRVSENNLQFVVKYVGEMTNGVPNGKGTLYTNQNDMVKGFYKDGLLHGQYVVYDLGGEIALESGMADHGKKTGTITYYYPSKFVSGIRGQLPFLDDVQVDGPFMTNEVSYSTGLIKRAFVGVRKDGVQEGTWEDVVSIRVLENYPISLYEGLFGAGKLTQEQINIVGNIDAGLRAGNVLIYDKGRYYANPNADISPAALDKLFWYKQYIPQVHELLKIYQRPYSATWVTTGTRGFVVVNDNQVTSAQFDPEHERFYGHAISTFINGDSFEGALNEKGTNYEGEVTYVSGGDGAKLVGMFSSALGRIEGPARYTFFDPTIKERVTKDVNVVNGEWLYKTKAQEDYETTRKGISGAWRGIFHNGNIFQKLENGVRLLRDSATLPFVWASVKWDLEKVGVSWSSADGAGIIIAKEGIGEYNLTFGALKDVAVLVTSIGQEKVATRLNIRASMAFESSEEFSYGIESNVKNVPEKSRERFKRATIAPIVGKKGAYFSSMTNVPASEAYDRFYEQRLTQGFAWTPEQKETLAVTIFDDEYKKKLGDQLGSEVISAHIEHFYSAKWLSSRTGLGLEAAGQIQAYVLTECISWTIARMKNGLKPEYKVQLYALVTLFKAAYDPELWRNLTDKSKREQLTKRQLEAIAGAMKALSDFEMFLHENGNDRSPYRVQEIPFRY